MRPCLMLSAMFIWLASAMTASAGEPTLTLDVWPDKAPGETGSIGPEKVIDQKPGDKPVKLLTNVTQPTLSVFRPACDKDTGVAVVICPGGGYNILAFDLEGEEVAAWLNSIGVTGIVLKYRVPRREGTRAIGHRSRPCWTPSGHSAWCGARPASGGSTRSGSAYSGSRRADT